MHECMGADERMTVQAILKSDQSSFFDGMKEYH